MTDLGDLSDDEALAAEYVLGTLPMADRYTAEMRMKSDVQFSELVEAWEAHFAPLNDAYAEVPAPNLMPAIEARLFGAKPPFWREYWAHLLIGAGVAAALAISVVVTLPQMQGGPTLSATLSDASQPVAFSATWHDGTLHVAHTGGPLAEAGKDYELWVIVADAAPVSLGVVSAAVDRALPVLAAGSVLAVTLEPAGGSPSGAPTGPIIAKGVVITG